MTLKLTPATTLLPTFLALCMALSATAQANNWSSTNLQLLQGSQYEEPGAAGDVARGILTLEHARGYEWGRLFMFADFSKDDRQGLRHERLYGEFYGMYGLSRATGVDLSAGILKDVNATLGINYGDGTDDANARILLPGITLDFDLPGFRFFSLDLLAYLDRGRENAGFCNGNSWQITPAWNRPFNVGNLKMQFSGFVDVIGRHGGCAAQVLTQPQLRVDIGDWVGAPGKLEAGFEYQYWNNKYGIRGFDEHLPQLMLLWNL